ncbi:putative phosphoesterase [Microbacterium sp. SORGH_AS428]|uniref:metallophosphoesterase family protein n=1 Tax=Microbacterium sp. SORGH_AS_0428 TaxID=3041788 RepID=UPI002863FFBB|nr:YfcE family phosphodiesterase [Microbacterium sp. SORGH_AS_0428]MDR6200256.1 putative phosphoesterase [Microbacterium sp. SORGH_AS_0428]
MTTRLLLISDTHIPARRRTLPDAVRRLADDADLIVHAGDWVVAGVLDDLARHGELVGVYGNNDGADLRARLPLVAHRRIEDVRMSVVHETGDARSRERRMDAAYPETDLLVFGHSHIPWDTVTPAGMRLLNPGSPTDRRRQPAHTCMRVTIDGDRIDATLVAL